MLPSAKRRAIWNVTLDGPGAGGGLHDESPCEVGGPHRPSTRATAARPGSTRGRILDEFCETTGYQRKYALRLLNGPPPGPERPRRRRRPATYGLAVIQALTAIWEAAGYPWSVRLKALLPLWLPWARRRLRLSATVCQQLRAISPRQIDRRLAADQAAAHDAPLWPDQARDAAQAPHPAEDRSLGRDRARASPSSTWWPMPAIGRMASSPIR